MEEKTIAYICIAGVAALLIALFQYIYKSKLNSRLKYSLFIARVITLFIIGLILINPKFESLTLYNEKPNLVLAIDNSESILNLNQEDNASNIIKRIKDHPQLNDRFTIKQYVFGRNLSETNNLTFSEPSSNISGSLEMLGEIYKGTSSPIVLISDGNQTLGVDYRYSAPKIKQPVYPIILGDSTIYTDLSINQLNVNRFAFLKNRFPVEAILNYSGTEDIITEFRIKSGEQIIYRKNIQFGPNKTSEVISTNILANKVGVRSFLAEITPLEDERNTNNNIKNFGVEIIDQKTNIAIISELVHPDLGTLKESIESNEQRKVSILSPIDFMASNKDFQLVILYQPNQSFNTVIESITDLKLNVFFITGETTDWTYLNSIQESFKQSVTNQSEGFQPILNKNYNNFIIEDINFDDFPPVKSEFGQFGIEGPHEVILYKSVNGINTNLILLATYETQNTKQAVFNGEGIWRWRSQSFVQSKSFESFDNFINKLVQYLSSNKRRSRLNVDYQSFYNGNEDIFISAQYFNKSYEFDGDAALTLILNPEDESKEKRQYPLLVTNGNYKVDLSGLDSGRYDFSIQHNKEAISASGKFEVLTYNVEKQFLNADINKLEQLASESSGNAYFPEGISNLINNLLADSRYNIVQKSTKNVVPLIDFKFLLGLLALSLFFEWFVRKYHGLI